VHEIQGAKMSTIPHFDDVVDAAGSLTIEEQEALIEILRRRIIEKNRRQIAKDIKDSQREFSEGKCQIVTPGQCIDEIMR
jgi:hypothetical protein